MTMPIETREFRFVSVSRAMCAKLPLDGRLLVMFSTDQEAEPRTQINDSPKSQQIFGIDVNDLKPDHDVIVDSSVLGYPLESLNLIPAGKYHVQALVHLYETFHRSDGHTVKLPMDRGEGQHWNQAPGNLYSTPQEVTIEPGSKPGAPISIALDKVIPPIPEPETTRYIKHERFQSDLLTKFWGRPMHLGAHVLLPEGFDTHPEARYPLVIFHGHFPHTFGGFREQPPDENLKPDFSERFHLAGYNRIMQEEAHRFYKEWTGPEVSAHGHHRNPARESLL